MVTKTTESWDDTFTDMWRTGIIPKRLNRVMVFGYSRTGKSTLIHKLTKSERITSHRQMPLEDLLGGMTLVNGSTKWMDGPATRALRTGTILQIDEANEIPIECITLWYALMDDPAGVTLPTGERVAAAPGYGVIMTMNPKPDCLPHPIFDRIDCFLKADTLSAGIKQALGKELADKAENIVGRNQQPIEDWSRPLTVHGLMAYAKLKQHGVEPERAAHLLGFTGLTQSDFMTAVTSQR
jgi:hypothetical protein